jgi:hypothetical protein
MEVVTLTVIAVLWEHNNKMAEHKRERGCCREFLPFLHYEEVFATAYNVPISNHTHHERSEKDNSRVYKRERQRCWN